MPYRLARIALLAILAWNGPLPAAWAASPPPVAAPRGMVVTGQHLATEVGVDILRHGGNAIDAAVAVGYALAVTYPAAGNLGGGGFMTIRFADGRTAALDFRERAPLAATATLYQDARGKVIPHLSVDGWLAVAVPGTVAGLELALTRYGTLPRAAVIAPAIRLADDGFVLGDADAGFLRLGADRLRRDPAAAAIFLRGGTDLYRPGDRLVQSDLAATLRRIAADGPGAFYGGPIGQAIIAAAQSGGGILQRQDFTAYQAQERSPVTCGYRGYRIISAPPPSSGGVVLCEMLNILEGYPLGDLGFHSAAEVHALVEAMRHAYADRNTALGDPDFVTNPLDRLLDKGYAAAIRSRIAADRAGRSADLMPDQSSLTGDPEGAQTTHYSIVDADGTAVAVTYTLNAWFGAAVVAGGTGILMNDEMDDFTSRPGEPNLFGLVQGAANAIAPGKAPLSSMSPTVVTRDDQTVMVIGSPGGSRIPTITLEAIINVIDHGMTIQEAIDAPRLHHQWLPDTVALEPFALSADSRRLLEQQGYRFTEPASWGLAEGILVGGAALGRPATDGQRLFGANDSRGAAGSAAGY